MSKLARFLSLSWADRALLAGATGALAVAVVAVRILPFRGLLRAAGALGAWRPAAHGNDARERVARAIAKAAPRVPGASCLPQALAARFLLGWFGEECQVRIGVAKSAQGKLEAHAWVESGGKVIVGGFSALDRYTPLPDLDSSGSPK